MFIHAVHMTSPNVSPGPAVLNEMEKEGAKQPGGASTRPGHWERHYTQQVGFQTFDMTF